MMRRKVVPFIAILILISVGCAQQGKRGGSTTSVAGTGNSGLDINDDSDSGNISPIETVYFAFNSASLTSKAKGKLKTTAEFLDANKEVQLQIEGHCDERGGVQYNLALGERRARSVKRYLTSLGIASGRLSTISFGKEKPITDGHEEDAWSQNRRGNFVVTAN
ncbi:MAG: peptidoglycan-associated lipoprotein Pal [Halobacteriovoraceae bacterium]|nr:peptidoglycan-associated lipoprotein Pal [Halobacteriovoraceae bacterium]